MFNCALSFSETFHENYCLFTSYMNYISLMLGSLPPNQEEDEVYLVMLQVCSHLESTFLTFHIWYKKRKTCSYIQAKIISSRFSLQMCILWKVNQTGHPFYYLHSPSGISSRLLYAALNISKLWSFPMFAGIPSKSSLLELRYNFFKEDSLCREP